MRAERAGSQLTQLGSELDRLTQALWAWSPTRWTDARVAAARVLAGQLLSLTAAAGAPPLEDAELPVVASYALADQLAVLGRDFLAAPDAERAAAQARSHLAAARAALDS